VSDPILQEQIINKLDRKEMASLERCLLKISSMTWDQIFKHKGLNLERIKSISDKHGDHIYSIRVTLKFRARIKREKDTIRFISLHSDHDSAYH